MNDRELTYSEHADGENALFAMPGTMKIATPASAIMESILVGLSTPRGTQSRMATAGAEHENT